MKRFWLFEFGTYYPTGGMSDLKGTYDTAEEARENMAVGFCIQIFDSKEQKLVKTGNLVDDIEIKHLNEQLKK